MLTGGGGKIVNVGAFAAQKGAANMGAYVAAKSAVIRLTESMAAELREKNINVNCVLPTIIDTPENRSAMPKADPRRWVAAEDLANVIAFLASPAAKAIHGAAVPVTGLSSQAASPAHQNPTAHSGSNATPIAATARPSLPRVLHHQGWPHKVPFKSHWVAMPRARCSAFNRNISLFVIAVGVQPQIWLAAQL